MRPGSTISVARRRMCRSTWSGTPLQLKVKAEAPERQSRYHAYQSRPASAFRATPPSAGVVPLQCAPCLPQSSALSTARHGTGSAARVFDPDLAGLSLARLGRTCGRSFRFSAEPSPASPHSTIALQAAPIAQAQMRRRPWPAKERQSEVQSAGGEVMTVQGIGSVLVTNSSLRRLLNRTSAPHRRASLR